MAGHDAFGTQLERSTDGGTTFTAIGNVTSFSGPAAEREAYDVTAHDGPNNFREFVGGLVNGGEVSCELNYDPAIHDTLYDDFSSDTAVSYKMSSPVGESWEFSAILTGFEREMPVDDKMTATLTWQVTGKPTLTAAA